jgi:hypothetical protein|tara:strand:+ start:138 stop:353 length:216 start_codon:yes stop_codon:yes gene_type:complete
MLHIQVNGKMGVLIDNTHCVLVWILLKPSIPRGQEVGGRVVYLETHLMNHMLKEVEEQVDIRTNFAEKCAC